MTTIRADIIADSVSPDGVRLTTMQLRYPRAIHAEFMTHRVFSRNASSSRAIPVSRLIQDVMDDPFIPSHWGKDQRGMQADGEHDGRVDLQVGYTSGGVFHGYSELSLPREIAWLRARNNAVQVARAFADAGYHKQVVNRLLEPFAHINVVVTATEWANFLHLRDHKDAEPHIAILAREMKKAMDGSTPRQLHHGEWHLPYVETTNSNVRDWVKENLEVARKISVARCASVSYKTVDGREMTPERATALYDKLVASSPLHASPLEHQATPNDKWATQHLYGRSNPLSGNFHGAWNQFRKMVPGENVTH